jgi:class 3 adenylate cyclase/TolB-like protein/Tfp pilus assembly protein PilF
VSATGGNLDVEGVATDGRKLIAIVRADVVGYSRLIGLDDAGTLNRLRNLRRTLIDPAIREHGGSVVQTGGDSLLVAFDSIDGAMRCAVKVQQKVPVYDGDQPPDRRIRFRVGINIGDVIPDGTDLHGDGVNIATRLEAECPVGGICVSRSVRDHVHGRLHLTFEALGPLTLKNIARPVEAFVVRLDPTAEVSADEQQPATASPRARSRTVLIAGGVGLLACGAAGVGWWMLHGTTAPVASSTVASATAQDRRQSVIVLPFENSSGDPAQDGVSAAITRELTDHLARRHDGPVIPATVAAAYRGKMVDPSAIGRQHDVHFALVGSARRQDGRLIVSAIVYETASGRMVWSRQFDRQDGPDAQEAIAQSIYESFWQVSVDEEVERAMREHPNSLDARDLMFAALSTRLMTPTKAHAAEQIALIDRALVLDPNNFPALERQARWYSQRVMLGYSSDPTADLTIADKAADHLLAINPNNLNSLRAKAFVLRAQGKWSEAEAVLRRVIDLQPTEANRRWELGLVLMAEGRHQEALESFQTAKRFAGGDDPVFLYDADIAMAELAIGQFGAATASARRSLSGYPPNSGRLGEVPWLALIAAESGSGQDDAAPADLQKFLATSRSWGSMAAIEKWPAFAANPKLLDGLRHAGMPAE